ncbi:MAG: branched-chain amino acid aminotransferase [Rikenellaceae bacterium]
MENIDWKSLSFGYVKCDENMRAECVDGKWGELYATEDEYLHLHMSAPSLHYGAEVFEGLKAFRGIDGKIRLFRVEENARRMIRSAQRLCMPAPSEEMFIEACVEVVRRNERFVPPYGTGASLYIRPLLIGSNAVLGIHPPHDMIFCVFCSPVGAYFKGGMSLIDVIVNTDYDRAAPRGTGGVKCGGNYAASLLSGEIAAEKGYANVLYLDATEHKYIEECGAANFFGIKEGLYVTPSSPSVLPSITNMSLRQLAMDMGLKVVQRHIELDELSTFDECGACGTAAVISPIGKIFDPYTDTTYSYGDKVGSYSAAMYERLQGIQYGLCEDTHGWITIVE